MKKSLKDSICAKCQFGICVMQEETIPINLPPGMSSPQDAINMITGNSSEEDVHMGQELVTENIYGFCMYPQSVNPNCRTVIPVGTVKECSRFKADPTLLKKGLK